MPKKTVKKYFHRGNSYTVSIPKRYEASDPNVKEGKAKAGEVIYLRDPVTGNVLYERGGITPRVARHRIEFTKFEDGSKLKDGFFCVKVLTEDDPPYVEEYLDGLLADSGSGVMDYNGYVKIRTPEKFNEMIARTKAEQEAAKSKEELTKAQATIKELESKLKGK